MLETPKDLRETILEHLFPDLRYGGDPDIERYFELRNQGRTLDALSIYRNKLVPRYPDQDKRLILLRLYRQHSPQYPIVLKNLLLERADELILRLKTNIDTLVQRIAAVDMKNTYAVLKAMEQTARLLPDDQDKARDFAKNYQEYAAILDYRQKEMNRLCFLLDEFYSQTSTDSMEGADFLAMSQASEDARRKQEEEAQKQNFFDLSRINFDQNDIQRIEIPAHIERNEDKALAYCYKYWLRVHDSAFERVIWLYSRKYNTQHYQIFKTIKICRLRKYSDDEILSMVTSCITTEYSYTVQGDIYMQQAWKQLKANLFATAKPAAPQTEKRDNARNPKPKPAAITKTTVKQKPAKTKQASAKPDKPQKTTMTAATPKLQAAKSKPNTTSQNRLVLQPAYSPGILPSQIANGSISDMIKKMSGKAYDVHRDVFFAKLRPVIRDELARKRGKGYGLFDDKSTRAENIVYDFMEKNYYNSFMDWNASQEKEELANLGFEISILDGIIERCYHKITN